MIAAEGEQKASRALREAAAVIAESPSALQVFFKSKKTLRQGQKLTAPNILHNLFTKKFYHFYHDKLFHFQILDIFCKL